MAAKCFTKFSYAVGDNMSKNYAVVKLCKLKSTSDFAESFKHNTRLYKVSNADPDKEYLNREAVGLNGLSYEGAYKRTIRELKIAGRPERTIRKDAVRGFEVILTYSREGNGTFSQDERIKANVDWLRKTFNPPDMEIHFKDAHTGKEQSMQIDNVKHVIVHNDESCPHIHAFIVPIDERGNLNAKYYTAGRQTMRAMQDSYAKAMAPFGLERGEYKSIAEAEEIKRFYTGLTNAVRAELPPPYPGEKTEAYRERANEAYKDEMIHHRMDVVKLKQEVVEAHSDGKREREALARYNHTIGKQVRSLQRVMGCDELGERELKDIKHTMKQAKDLEYAKENYPDRDKARATMENLNEMLDWLKGKRRKRDKETSLEDGDEHIHRFA